MKDDCAEKGSLDYFCMMNELLDKLAPLPIQKQRKKNSYPNIYAQSEGTVARLMVKMQNSAVPRKHSGGKLDSES
jgi:hypothetical protein